MHPPPAHPIPPVNWQNPAEPTTTTAPSSRSCRTLTKRGQAALTMIIPRSSSSSSRCLDRTRHLPLPRFCCHLLLLFFLRRNFQQHRQQQVVVIDQGLGNDNSTTTTMPESRKISLNAHAWTCHQEVVDRKEEEMTRRREVDRGEVCLTFVANVMKSNLCLEGIPVLPRRMRKNDRDAQMTE